MAYFSGDRDALCARKPCARSGESLPVAVVGISEIGANRIARRSVGNRIHDAAFYGFSPQLEAPILVVDIFARGPPATRIFEGFIERAPVCHEAYCQVRARVNYRHPGDQWEAKRGVQNLTDEHYSPTGFRSLGAAIMLTGGYFRTSIAHMKSL